jgi:diacylglycerol kinase family enzyme
MKVVLVYNAKSGSIGDVDIIRHTFKNASIDIKAWIELDDNIEKNLQPFIQADDNIAVIGGDGTISTIAGLLANTKAVLIPLPGGTLNHFTKDLGISQSLDEALKNSKLVKPQQIDVAKVNDKIFINNSSIGLYSTSLKIRKAFEGNVGKLPATVIASIWAFIRFRTYIVEVDNETYHSPFIFIGNNRYDFKLPSSIERKELNKGNLTVFIANTTSRRRLFAIAFHALIGKSRYKDEFRILYKSSVTVKTHRTKVHVSCDGEITNMNTPLHYKIEPLSLWVISGTK